MNPITSITSRLETERKADAQIGQEIHSSAKEMAVPLPGLSKKNNYTGFVQYFEAKLIIQLILTIHLNFYRILLANCELFKVTTETYLLRGA